MQIKIILKERNAAGVRTPPQFDGKDAVGSVREIAITRRPFWYNPTKSGGVFLEILEF